MLQGGPIRTLIVHDHRLIREGLRLVLSGAEGIEIAGRSKEVLVEAVMSV